MRNLRAILTLLLASILLAACASTGSGGAGTSAEKYFQAIADGDDERIATLSCPDWESSARDDVAAFVGVKARLENVSCASISENNAADSAVVECSGAIVATYNNEDTEFELKGKQLNVVKMGSEWLVCGYTQ